MICIYIIFVAEKSNSISSLYLFHISLLILTKNAYDLTETFSSLGNKYLSILLTTKKTSISIFYNK